MRLLMMVSQLMWYERRKVMKKNELSVILKGEHEKNPQWKKSERQIFFHWI